MKYSGLLYFILVPEIVLASEKIAEQPGWYEYLVGILAIPAAIIGIAYSYLLVKKTRLEARKTELEIIEKETAISALNSESTVAAREFVKPIIEGRTGQILLLRFVLLWVVLQLWDIVESIYNLVTGGAFLGLQEYIGVDFDSVWVFLPLMFIQSIPDIVKWLIVVGLGWPLFRDLNRYLNIDFKSLLRPWKK